MNGTVGGEQDLWRRCLPKQEDLPRQRPHHPRWRTIKSSTKCVGRIPDSPYQGQHRRRENGIHKSGGCRNVLVACTRAVEGPGDENHEAWTQSIVKKMGLFMIPAVITPLADPLMSLVDTVCIGQFAGTQELAALGPANLIFAFAQYAFTGLSIATISLTGERLREERLLDANTLVRTALFLGVCCGSLTLCVLESFAEPLVVATGAQASLVPLTCMYVRIRALAGPAVLLISVGQSALLAQRDSWTPLVIVVFTTLVSFIGNLVAVAGLGWGLYGAAVTTVLTQWVGAVAVLVALRYRGKIRPGVQLPSLGPLLELVRAMGALSVTYLCKNLCYILLQSTAATLDTIRLAAHQAMFSVWNLLAFTTAPAEQAALTFIPGVVRPWQRQFVGGFLIRMGLVLGLVNGCLVALVITQAPQWLSKDPTLWPCLGALAAQGCLSMIMLGMDVAATGILLAKRDLSYVARAYVVTLLGLVGYLQMWRQYQWGLGGVWWGMMLFFSLRAFQSLGRLLVLRHEERGEQDWAVAR